MDDIPPPMRAAIKASNKSTQRYKLGAAIAKGNKVLVTASNSNKTHPRFGSGAYSKLHAEGAAISKAVRQGINLKGTSIFIFRRGQNLAKPCSCCMSLIDKYGIKNVIYSQ